MSNLVTAIKNFLKRFLPPPVHAFNREVERILAAVGQQQRGIAALEKKLTQHQQLAEGMEAKLAQHQQLAEHLEQTLTQQRRLTEALEAKLTQHQQAAQMLAAQLEAERTAAARREKHLQKTLADCAGQIAALGEAQSAAMGEISGKLSALSQAADEGPRELAQELGKAQQDMRRELAQSVEKVRRQAAEASRHASEAVWAQIFNSAIRESAWLLDKTFAPGRWAVGYPYLYVMYRVLNEARPKRILELGLGQSTRMIAQYAAAFDDVEHIVVEHDQDWIDFFCKDFNLSPCSKLVRLDREMMPYKDAEAVRVFKNFRETFAGQKFDFISIDAPLGADMKQYSRIDVLGLMPDCLAEDFVIMVDDTTRSGEIHTLEEMENCLKQAQIPYRRGRYSGAKDCVLLCANKLGFLSSM